jgi:hypothetical protein
MTRARCSALALLLSVCCLGPAPLYAQYAQGGPAAPAADDSRLFPAPEGTSQADCPPFDPGADCPPWYGCIEEIQSSSGRFGPIPVASGWRLRAEYLNWMVKKPGNQLLGAPVQGVVDPTKPFFVFAPGTASPIAVATVPTTQSIDLSNISGLRVTGALDLIAGGQVEVSAFMLARKQSGFFLATGKSAPFDDDFDFGSDPFEALEGETPLFLPLVSGTSVLFNGQISDHIFLYNVSYQAIFQSRVWGAEANYLTSAQDPEALLQCRGLVGFRYINLSERLTQRGVFQDFLLGGPPVVTTIDSLTMNNLYGAQIGLRTQLVTSWLELGITPKLLFMGNTMVASVFTNHLRTNNDGTFSSNDQTSTFCFGAEGQAYAQANIAPHISVRIGWDVLYLTRVTRPQTNIVYNDNGPAAPPGLVEQTKFTDIFISGWSVGMQIQY